MQSEFKSIVEQDIEKCIEQIEQGNKNTRYGLISALNSKYGSVIQGFSDGLHSLWYDDIGEYILENVKILKEKLELFKAIGYPVSKYEDVPKIDINNSNLNSNIFEINISFDEARKSIENMSALPDTEIDEILDKIDELEKIVCSKFRKSKKWESAKDIIKWMADKGVDVGITLLPLLLQIK